MAEVTRPLCSLLCSFFFLCCSRFFFSLPQQRLKPPSSPKSKHQFKSSGICLRPSIFNCQTPARHNNCREDLKKKKKWNRNDNERLPLIKKSHDRKTCRDRRISPRLVYQKQASWWANCTSRGLTGLSEDEQKLRLRIKSRCSKLWVFTS